MNGKLREIDNWCVPQAGDLPGAAPSPEAPLTDLLSAGLAGPAALL